MSKFHINKHGVPAPCKATKGNCPLGGSDTHFDSLEDAQAYADQENEKEYELMPDVAKKASKANSENKEEEKKLTPAQIKRKEKVEWEARLTNQLAKSWSKRDGTPDENMIKHCLKHNKYVELENGFVEVADAKPTISSDMWYDDETEAPQVNFENFRQYNVRIKMPKEYELRGRNMDGIGSLKMIPQYGGEAGLGIATLTYEDAPDGEYIEVNESQLEEINKGVREVKEDYEKRLKSYYKRYGDKIYARGYWRDR